MRRRPQVPLTLALIGAFVVAWLVIDVAIPLIASLSPAGRPLAIPRFARVLYLVLAIVGIGAYVTSTADGVARVREEVASFLQSRGPRRRWTRAVRAAVLVALPLAVAAVTYVAVESRAATPVALRIQHPGMPQAFESRSNPLRGADEAHALAEGRVLFQVACRPCHGAAANGSGPIARALRLKPVDFTDPGTIATVVEPYAFWRVSEGGRGLPVEATPWDSAMPAWKHDLVESDRWSAVMAAYDLAGVEPRRPEGSPVPAERAAARQRSGDAAQQPPGEAERSGRDIYLRRCAPCHGERGDGKGPVAPYLDPPPRDFTAGVYKLRSTASGDPPTDGDLISVVTRGMPGTAMPAWTVLDDRQRRAVVQYIKSLSDTFSRQPSVVTPPARQTSSITRGAEVYRQAKCWECHGDEGRGDGPSAASLNDDAGNRIVPADLTKGWRLKGGRDAEAIYLRLTTGMDGTPMPSYADSLGDEERWALARYVASLQQPDAGTGDTVLRVRRVDDGDVPRSADDPRWRDARALAVPLAGQVVTRPRWQNAAVDLVRVRALYGAQEIAFLLEWDDRSRDAASATAPAPRLGQAGYVLAERERGPALRDGLRLQFPLGDHDDMERPHFLLGTPGRPVVLWRWQAAADDSLAIVRETADGFERDVTPSGPAREFTGRARWANGRWQLLLVRPLTADAARDVMFVPGRLIPFALHAWDGGNGEHDLLMSMSSWNFLVLDTPTPAARRFAPLVLGALVAVGEWRLIRRARRR